MTVMKGMAAGAVTALAVLGLALSGCSGNSTPSPLPVPVIVPVVVPRPVKRTLYVFTHEATCAPCRRLKADWNAGRLRALCHRWKVVFVEYDPTDRWQRQFEIAALPTFATADHIHVTTGYEGSGHLLHVLGVR